MEGDLSLWRHPKQPISKSKNVNSIAEVYSLGGTAPGIGPLSTTETKSLGGWQQ